MYKTCLNVYMRIRFDVCVKKNTVYQLKSLSMYMNFDIVVFNV